MLANPWRRTVARPLNRCTNLCSKEVSSIFSLFLYSCTYRRLHAFPASFRRRLVADDILVVILALAESYHCTKRYTSGRGIHTCAMTPTYIFAFFEHVAIFQNSTQIRYTALASARCICMNSWASSGIIDYSYFEKVRLVRMAATKQIFEMLPSLYNVSYLVLHAIAVL